METEAKKLRTERMKNIQLVSAKQNGKAIRWQPIEDASLMLAKEIGLTVPQTVDCMNEDPELNYRVYTIRSIDARRLRLKLGGSHKRKLNDDSIMSCKKLLMKAEQSLVNYSNSHHITVKCNQCNHEWVKQSRNCTKGCPKCSNKFVGGLPTGPEPALVYLLAFPEWDKCKPGYTKIENSLSPEEAIHKTSKNRNYPYPYTIVAYDLSTKTEAGILEQTLLKDTFDSRSFIETQEFDGHTEFRNIKVLKQLLPQYKTVLDTAFRI